MTKLRSALVVGVLASLLILGTAAAAFGASRPVAAGNTPPAGFPAAQNCSCHSQFLQEWQQSMHAKALVDPIYKAKLAEGNAATKGAIGPFCLKCHGPVATMTGQLGKLDPTTAAGQGIGCSFCHQVTGATAPTNNVSLLVEPSGVYRAQIATATAPHAWAYSSFHKSSEICGSCHNVAHPGNGLPIEQTYTEWQASPQAKAGITCQDCHMSQAPGQIGPSIGWAAGGAPRRPVYQMTFLGAQVALSNAVAAENMLKSAATVTLDAPAILEGAKSTSATVTVTNVGAGHNLPTGLTEVREMWLELSLVAADGSEHVIGKHVYGTVLKDAAGKYPVQLWEATGVQSDDRIPAKGTSVQSFKIVFPQGVNGGTLRARLLYRSVPDSLAKQAGVQNPTTVMAESETKVYADKAAEKQANSVYLKEASASPLMPLVFAVLGIGLMIGLIIFFVWWGRKTSPKGKGPMPAKPAETSPESEEPGPAPVTEDEPEREAWAPESGDDES